MSREDIIRIAREAGCSEPSHPMNDWRVSQEDLERFATLVAAKEREDILRMSEAQFFKTQADYDDAIRAREHRDEIIRMAQQAGIRVASQSDTVDPRNVYPHELVRFAALVAAKENETIAEFVDDMDLQHPKYIASAIRARSQK